MGLLSVPKKYNPPGNGKRDMEYPIFATKQEMGLLKARGGSGKMTRHGIRSFGLGDKGNAVGSAGGSNYSGDGMGGQVNMDGVGMGGSNVLRKIDGRWTSVSRDVGAQIDAGGSIGAVRQKPAPVQYTPAAAPVQQTITAPISVPSIPASTLAAQYGMYKNPAANMPATPAAPASYPNSMPGNVNQSLNYGPGTSSSPTVNAVSPLGMGGTRGSWSTPSRPPNNTPASASPNSMPGNSDPGMNYGPGTTPSPPQGMGGTRGSWATPSRPPNNTPSAPTSNGPPTRGQMPNYGAGPAVDPNQSNDASYFGDVSDFQGSQPAARAITSMLAEAQRRAAENRQNANASYFGDINSRPDTYSDQVTGVVGGGGVPAYNSDLSLSAKNVSMPSRPGQATPPGWGVPDVPTSYAADMGRYGPAGQVGPVLNKITDRLTPDMSAPLGSRLGSPAPGYTYAEQRPAPVNRFAPPPSEVSADLWSRVGQLTSAMKRPAESAVGVPAGLGPSYGPETPLGAGPGQRDEGAAIDDDYTIDPTSSYPPEIQVTGNKVWNALQKAAKKTPAGIAIGLGMDAYDTLSGNSAYRDDVSLGTDESGKRTDRAPSGGGFSTSPGSFGPGGQDRRGGNFLGPHSSQAGKQPLTEADKDFVKTLPESERQRLRELRRTDYAKFLEELAKLKAAPPTGGGGTAPGTTGPFQWYYPQYQSTWANLPTGLGGTYGSA